MWLKLTATNGSNILINMSLAFQVKIAHNGETVIEHDRTTACYVKESIEEIEHLIRDFDNA